MLGVNGFITYSLAPAESASAMCSMPDSVVTMRMRAPSFVNLQALRKMVEGRLIADVIASIGTLDIVLGEIDR